MHTVARMTLLAVIIPVISCFAWKKQAHLVSTTLIDAGGIFTTVMVLDESNSIGTKASAITTLAFLSANAAADAAIMFRNEETYPILRIIHHSIGFALFASSLWMSIASSYDDGIKTYVKGIGYGYTAVTVVPIVIFF